MSPSKTLELKGLAILMVLFGHIGYFLFPGTNFLWPLSVASGVGVNIFLVVSGYGLSASLSKSSGRLLDFYKKRFLGIYPAMWLVISVFLVLDLFLLQKFYPASTLIKTYLGFFPTADLYNDLNSPLWYFTFIVFYYMLFPLVFRKKYPVLSALTLAIIGWGITKLSLPVDQSVLKLYQTHMLAFPLGVLLFGIGDRISKVRKIGEIVKSTKVVRLGRYALILGSLFVAGYTAIHSNVGQGIYREHLTSLITVLAFVIVFVLNNYTSRILTLFGTYSYEIYLIHWPLMYRYDFLYKHLDRYLATLLYLILLVVFGWVVKSLVGLLIPSKRDILSSLPTRF